MSTTPPPNTFWSAASLTRAQRWAALAPGQKGGTLWFTGLSGSGKSTIAAAVEAELIRQGRFCYRLDGDNIRQGLNSDLGFSHQDRTENIRRIAEVARLMADAGAVSLVSFISPYRADRAAARAIHARGPDAPLDFIEVHIDAPLSVCEQRDPKGLYKKARAGQITGFTGIDDPYEAPLHPELTLHTDTADPAACIRACMDLMRSRGLAPGVNLHAVNP